MIALNIEVPQHTIDVNVHPQKTEMKFEDEGRIFKAVYKAVLDAVRPKGQAGQLGQLAAQADHVQHHVEKGLQELNFGPPVMNFPIREEKPAMTWQEGATALAQDKSVKSVQSVADEEEKLPTAGMIPIGQVDDTYIIAQDGDSLYIVDQHAAHESAATSAMPSVSHSQESSCRIFMRSSSPVR